MYLSRDSQKGILIDLKQLKDVHDDFDWLEFNWMSDTCYICFSSSYVRFG